MEGETVVSAEEQIGIKGKLELSKPAGGAEVGASRREYRARFVRAGQIRAAGGRPGNIFIDSSALATNAGKFNNRAVFVDHAGWFNYPSLRNLVGVTDLATWNEETQSIDGVLRLYDTPGCDGIAELLDQVLSEGEQAPDIGLSIVFWPVFAPRDNDGEPKRVIDVKHVESVDLVFEPAADGRVLEALSALNQFSNETRLMPGCARAAPAKLAKPLPTEQGESEMSEQETTPTAGAAGADQTAAAWLNALSASATVAMLANSGLPQASRERLAAGTYETPEALQAAVEGERGYLAKLAADNVVQLGGPAPRGGQKLVSGHIAGMRTGLDQVTAAFEAMMMGVLPPSGVAPLTGLRELYHLLSGDYEMTGVFQGERVYLSNVNSSTMAGLVANALNKVVVNEFMQYPRWWEAFVAQQDFANLQDVKWITLGGVGELPTVAEGAAYTELTWDDKTESAAFVKKGGYLGITLESIDKDDTGRLKAAPRALAQSAWLTLGKSISAIFTANSGVGPTLGDTGALFNSTAVTSAGGHANLGTTALSITTWNAARLAMRKQVELNSGERLGALTAPKYLLVPPDLEITALQVLGTEKDYTYTLSNGQTAPENVEAGGNDREARMNLARKRVIVMDLWTDVSDWAAVADPRLYPTIGLAFRYGRTPEIFSVASPTAGLMFTNDTMPVKVRFFFATGPMDFKGLYKANVA